MSEARTRDDDWREARAKLIREKRAKDLALVMRTAGNPDWWMGLSADERRELRQALMEAMQRLKGAY